MLAKHISQKLGVVARRYIGRPFSEFNCMQIVERVYLDLGVIPAPWSYAGYDSTTYLTLYNTDREAALALLKEFMATLGAPGNPLIPMVGDFVIKLNPITTFGVGIYVGGGSSLCSNVTEGVTLAPCYSENRIFYSRRMF